MSFVSGSDIRAMAINRQSFQMTEKGVARVVDADVRHPPKASKTPKGVDKPARKRKAKTTKVVEKAQDPVVVAAIPVVWTPAGPLDESWVSAYSVGAPSDMGGGCFFRPATRPAPPAEKTREELIEELWCLVHHLPNDNSSAGTSPATSTEGLEEDWQQYSELLALCQESGVQGVSRKRGYDMEEDVASELPHSAKRLRM